MKETPQPERQGQPEKLSLTLAEKTVDEVLRHFGSALNDARQHYRAFVEKGLKQGRRPELQGGGLVRPACHARHENIWKEQVVGIVVSAQ